MASRLFLHLYLIVGYLGACCVNADAGVAPTVTTTGSSCSSFSDDPSLQAVEDTLPPGASVTYAPVTHPPVVVIGTSDYTGTSGTVVVGKSTVTLASITATTVITIGGTTATLLPKITRLEPGVNNWQSWGLVPPSSVP
ncbi:hypothetical protein F5Y10DRAFT_284510 [Nemania abortiva]|nr:hypothetical protein F5Y10DRAFT_284510 [Nemania abortiva]